MLAVLALTAALAGCNHGRLPVSFPKTTESCPVTRRSSTPASSRGGFNYGNRFLGVALWPKGRLIAGPLPDGSAYAEVNPDGSVVAKLGWDRRATGRLTIYGERLDGDAPPLGAHVPGGYGNIGFQATGLTFPTQGCWKVVGSVGEHKLTFVVLVTKYRRPLTPRRGR